MLRTIVTKCDDGHIIFTKQRCDLPRGGNSKQRRKRARWLEDARNIPEWTRCERLIFRPEHSFPAEKAASFFPNRQRIGDLGQLTPAERDEIEVSVVSNNETAKFYVETAAGIVADIEQQVASFTVKPWPRIVVELRAQAEGE